MELQYESKGKKNGLCNRVSCLSGDYVVYFNTSTRAYYCKKCADMINKANWFDNGLKPLCVLDNKDKQ